MLHLKVYLRGKLHVEVNNNIFIIAKPVVSTQRDHEECINIHFHRLRLFSASHEHIVLSSWVYVLLTVMHSNKHNHVHTTTFTECDLVLTCTLS